tara:strand:+ start:6517 stop:6801 length:285 start_codon:yes stop_codon:yes gene_type:complete
MNRKNRRDMKRRKKEDPQQAMAKQVGLFEKLPSACDACQKSFDKRDKDMVFSWSVVVKQETVRLFCPECIKIAKEALNVQNEKEERTTDPVPKT